MNCTRQTVSALFLAALLLFTTACATKQHRPPVEPTKKPRPYKVLGKWYQPLASATGYDKVGVASWYGPNFHGKLTANGEKYNMHAMTAAHKTLPLGTFVKVRHLKNGKTVVLRINDRGPFVGSRIIDLSNKAAHAIGMVGSGTARVRVTAIPGKTPSSRHRAGPFGVQIASFGNMANATAFTAKLSAQYPRLPVKTMMGKTGLTRVVVGRLSTRDGATDLQQRLIQDGFSSAFIIGI